MNFINLDLFRAGLKAHPERKIHYYVMPHWPGNTPESWRRQFYGDLAHGMKIVDLFEFRPVEGAYTENHVNLPEMYLTVRRALYELARFEDIVQDGQIRPGVAALWFGETSDIWNDNAHPYGAAKRALYIAARHQQLPLDMVTERDVVAGGLRDYQVLYLADRHISRRAAEAVAKWVESGGSLLATAGAGLHDEFNEPLGVMEQLLGIESAALEAPTENAVRFIKQDLPFEVPRDVVTWFSGNDAGRIPVFGPRSRFKVTTARLEGTFSDGSPAVTVRDVGDGQARYCGFLPGLSYFGPAVPRRPVDRGTTPQAMSHFIPTEFDPGAYHLVGAAATGIDRPVVCSEPLVAAGVIQSRAGTVIPVVNWSSGPVKGLTVSVNFQAPSGKAQLASGRPLVVREENEHREYQFDLDVADAIILR
jgi:hypothetical protein